MPEAPTQAVWITHNPTTVVGIRGLLQQLDAVSAAGHAQIRIIAVDPEKHHAVQFPAGIVAMPDGQMAQLSEPQDIPWDRLPEAGILIIGTDE